MNSFLLGKSCTGSRKKTMFDWGKVPRTSPVVTCTVVEVCARILPQNSTLMHSSPPLLFFPKSCADVKSLPSGQQSHQKS